MSRVLVLMAHPNFHQSKVNRMLAQTAQQTQGVTFHDLYATYPDGTIDIAAEQRLIAEHDILVFQHPFYWYSAPSLLKEWQDLVLQYNYAYGPTGDKLSGKKWLSVITTGGGAKAYCAKGHNRFSIRQLLTPFEQTAYFCDMEFLPPFVLHGAKALGLDKNRLAQYQGYYQSILQGLVEDSFTISARWQLMNDLWESA